MKRVAVLGAGRVGSLIARTLAAETGLAVRAVDRSGVALGPLRDAGVETRAVDVSDSALLGRAVEGVDTAVLAVPGSIGFQLLEALVELRIPTVDISFSPEDPRALNPRARERGVTVVVDCGVAPGLSNVMVGHSVAEMDAVESVRILVGGLPTNPEPPWGYRAVFSPADVIEEYVRPARIRVDGEDVVRSALSDVEEIDFDGVGTLEAFLTDGLRTLLDTVPARTMVEKTLRWPGHAERVRALRDSGFFRGSRVEVDGAKVAPRRLAEALLARAWALRPGEEEFTLLRVEVEGTRAGERVRDHWELLDRTDLATGATSMARTTGFPAVAVARLVADGRWDRPGVHPPEVLGRELAVAEAILGEVERRGVAIRRRTEPLPESAP